MPEQPSPDSSSREPEGTRIFALLLKLGGDPEEVYASVKDVQSMAAENVIARIESKLEAMRAELRSFRWFIAAGIVFAVFIITLVQLLLAVQSPG